MRIIDRRSIALGHGHARIRNQNAIRRICIHHSVTPATHTTANFENWWRNPASRMGTPPVGGYHEVILADGDMELNFNPTQVIHGVANQNGDSYHICVVGSFRVNGSQPTAAQMNSLIKRLRFNMDRFNIPVERVLGHNEFPGHRNNTCPGQNMNNIRNQLRMPSIIIPSPDLSSTSSANTHTVRSGDTLSIIAQRNGTTVAELQRLNNILDANVIRIGQVLRLPTSNYTQPISDTIQVGSRVRVNADARNWVTGQVIHASVHGQVYDVQQIGRGGNDHHILIGRGGVATGWIDRSGVVLV